MCNIFYENGKWFPHWNYFPLFSTKNSIKIIFGTWSFSALFVESGRLGGGTRKQFLWPVDVKAYDPTHRLTITQLDPFPKISIKKFGQNLLVWAWAKIYIFFSGNISWLLWNISWKFSVQTDTKKILWPKFLSKLEILLNHNHDPIHNPIYYSIHNAANPTHDPWNDLTQPTLCISIGLTKT